MILKFLSCLVLFRFVLFCFAFFVLLFVIIAITQLKKLCSKLISSPFY